MIREPHKRAHIRWRHRGIRIAVSMGMLSRRANEQVRPRQPRRPRKSGAPVVATLANQLLAALPDPVLARLTPHLEPVLLTRKEVLFRAHEPLTFLCRTGRGMYARVTDGRAHYPRPHDSGWR
jgi:hypothetical protein